MNWTGGRLSRHSRNVNRSEAHQQKQHFAKVRSSLLSRPPRRSPIKWSVFGKEEGGAQRDSEKPSDTQLLARYKSHKQSEYRSEVNRKRRKRPLSVASLGQALSENTAQAGFVGGMDNQLLYDGSLHPSLYHETQLPSCDGRVKYWSPSVETANGVAVDAEVDSLQERRRRILHRIDWVGANIQHPIKLRFTATGNDKRLGKRRRLTAGEQNQRGAIVQQLITSPFPKSRRTQQTQGLIRGKNREIAANTEGPPKNHVRISIDGRQVIAGATSSTSRSNGLVKQVLSSHTSTSDVMLLDKEEMGMRHEQRLQRRKEHPSNPAAPHLPRSLIVTNGPAGPSTPRNPPVYTPHRKRIISPYARSSETFDRRTAATLVGLRREIPTAWIGQDNHAIKIAKRFDENVSSLCDPSNGHTASLINPHSNLVTLRGPARESHHTSNRNYADANQVPAQDTNPKSSPPPTGYITDISRQLSKNSRKLLLVKSPKIANRGSQSQLLHPIPLTSRTSRLLLRSISLEPAESTAAQIGVRKPSATASQVLDEEIWKSWVLSSDDDYRSGNGEYDNSSISPGVSNFGRYTQQGSKQREGDTDIDKPQELSHKSNTHGQLVEQSKAQSPEEIETQDGHEVAIQDVKERADAKHILLTKQDLDYKILFRSCPKRIKSPPNPVQVENPDEAWMKFILSDDDGDDEGDVQGVLKSFGQRKSPSPAPIRLHPESSLIVHPSTESASSTQLQFETSSRAGCITAPGRAVPKSTVPSINDPHAASNHATQGSNQLSDPLSQDCASTQLQPEPHHPALASSVSISPQRADRRLTFTRPPRFGPCPGGVHGPDAVTAALVRSPVRIGRRLLKRVATGAGLRDGSRKREKGGVVSMEIGAERRREQDIYSLHSESDVESIEDD